MTTPSKKVIGRFVVVDKEGELFVPSFVHPVTFESLSNANRRMEYATKEFPSGAPYRVVRVQFFEFTEAHDNEAT